MDYNISYYTIGALGQRLWRARAVRLPGHPGQDATRPYPDLATARARDQQRRQDLHGDDPDRRDVEHHARRARSPRPTRCCGLKRACNPVQPFGGLPDFETLIVGYQALLHQLRQARVERDPGRR